MSRSYITVNGRITDEQSTAFEQALDQHELRTGHRLTQIDIIRAGISQFCQSEGVRFPSFYEATARKKTKRTAAKDNVAK